MEHGECAEPQGGGTDLRTGCRLGRERTGLERDLGIEIRVKGKKKKKSHQRLEAGNKFCQGNEEEKRTG